MHIEKDANNKYFLSLFAGGAAGVSVDVALFPLDTIKTRLQSEVGLKIAGGLRNIYNGLELVALGSAPNAAIFFFTYEFTKRKLYDFTPENEFLSHALAATAGEVAACVIRVPVEVIKQRRQTAQHLPSSHIFRACFQEEGIYGLYRGYLSTVYREIPFAFIQYPLWEFLKKFWKIKQGRKIEPWQSAFSGAIAGGVAAALTTPLDVAKTRIMLAKAKSKEAEGKIVPVLLKIYKTNGVKAMFLGILPRSFSMALGGGIFFGVYELATNLLAN